MHSRTNDNIMVGRKRKSQNKVTRARMLMRYYDATKRIGVYERHDNEAMPYPLARRSVYAARSSSYPPLMHAKGDSLRHRPIMQI